MRKNWLQLSMTATLATTFTLSTGCKSMNGHEHDDDDNEVKMAFADAPAAVQATFKAQAPGATFTSVELEAEGGKKFYEADATMNGKKWEICVDESGKLISKEEDDDKDDDDDKEDK